MDFHRQSVVTMKKMEGRNRSRPNSNQDERSLGEPREEEGRSAERRLFLSPLGKRTINHVLADQLRSSWILDPTNARREGLNDDGVNAL